MRVCGVSTYTIPNFILDLINFILFSLQMLSTIDYYYFINEMVCIFTSGEMFRVAKCLDFDR